MRQVINLGDNEKLIIVMNQPDSRCITMKEEPMDIESVIHYLHEVINQLESPIGYKSRRYKNVK